MVYVKNYPNTFKRMRLNRVYDFHYSYQDIVTDIYIYF